MLAPPGIASERTVTAAYLVSDGIDMSCVGYVADRYQKHFDLLDGRIAQVVRFLDDSDDAKLRTYSYNNGGAYDAVLIDRVIQGDEELNKLLAYD